MKIELVTPHKKKSVSPCDLSQESFSVLCYLCHGDSPGDGSRWSLYAEWFGFSQKFDQCKIRNSGTLQSLIVHWPQVLWDGPTDCRFIACWNTQCEPKQACPYFHVISWSTPYQTVSLLTGLIHCRKKFQSVFVVTIELLLFTVLYSAEIKMIKANCSTSWKNSIMFAGNIFKI